MVKEAEFLAETTSSVAKRATFAKAGEDLFVEGKSAKAVGKETHLTDASVGPNVESLVTLFLEVSVLQGHGRIN